MPTRHEDYHAVFQSDALPPDRLRLARVVGRERLAGPYEFELTLEAPGEDPLEIPELDAMLDAPARWGTGAEGGPRTHGVLREVELVSTGEGSAHGDWTYRAVLVPRWWRASLTRRSRIYQDATVQEIVRHVFIGTGFVDGEDFEFFLADKPPRLEYVVQYEETDLDFTHRLLEHFGLFYYFEHTAGRERIIVCDQNNDCRPLPGQPLVPYDPRGGMTDPDEAVFTLSRVTRRVTRGAVLREYNARTPSTEVIGRALADPSGRGVQVTYGEHVKSPDEAARMAKVRAEEIRAAAEVYRGQSRVRGLHAGARFVLEGHDLSGMDQEYLVTAVEHRVAQAATTDGTGEGYHNRFEAIPYRVQYRPPRETPRPRIHGVMHAKVAGASDGVAAPVDAFGRYKCVMPYDSTGTESGSPSRWIRMAQPMSGADYGVHFRLHAGAEVLLAHVDGDPDRPLIVGSVPNAETSSPVRQENATQSVIRSRAGITFELEDDA